MEEALFRVTITLANFLQKLVWLEVNLLFYQMFSNTDIAVKIIKLKVEAGQSQHYIVGVTLLSTSM